MKEVVILSGKGGTGKTSIVGSFAAIAQNKIMVDCDVDAADLHLLLKPSVKKESQFCSGQTAVIDQGKCVQCGLCKNICRYNAVVDFEVDPISCEGCGFCIHICPVDAIAMKESIAGDWYISDTKYGPLVHARLRIAQENSGKLIALIRQKTRELANRGNFDYIISDGPPGIGCPVISSLSGVNLALLVTEPTLSGIHDLERVLGVCRHFDVSALVCINKYDLNEDNTNKIESYCNKQGVEVAAKIPFDIVFTQAMVKGIPIVEYKLNSTSNQIEQLWTHILKKMEGSCVMFPLKA